MSDRTVSLEILALTRSDWPVVERLFGNKGACGGCWCMYWRVEKGGRTWDKVRGEEARRRFQQLVEEGEVHGMLAFAEGAPVGWCSFGPYASFPRLGRSRTLQRERGLGVWSIVCFYIPPSWRNRGVATQLLKESTRVAFARGATEVEGYPAHVRPGSKLPGAFAWTGVASMFETVGFLRLEREEEHRAIYVAWKERFLAESNLTAASDVEPSSGSSGFP